YWQGLASTTRWPGMAFSSAPRPPFIPGITVPRRPSSLRLSGVAYSYCQGHFSSYSPTQVLQSCSLAEPPSRRCSSCERLIGPKTLPSKLGDTLSRPPSLLWLVLPSF